MTDELLNKDIIEVLGLEKLPEDKKTEMRDKMATTLQNRIANRLDQELTDAQKEEFNKISDTSDEKKITSFLDANIENMEKVVMEETLNFKHEMKQQADNVRNIIK